MDSGRPRALSEISITAWLTCLYQKPCIHLRDEPIPLGVFVNAGEVELPEGWKEAPRYLPEWWHDEASPLNDVDVNVQVVVKTRKSSSAKKSRLEEAAERMDDLFADQSEVAPAGGESGLIDALFSSEVYREARKRAGRAAIREDQLRIVLELLEQNNGLAMESVIMQHLSMPKIRLRGFLAGAQKLLNIDGYPILVVDRNAETVKLDSKSLRQQFEL